MSKLKFSTFIICLFFVQSSVFLRADCVFIGVTGGSASGKTTLAREVVRLLQTEGPDRTQLNPNEVGLLSQDNYFLPEKQPESDYVKGRINYDHPSAMDFALMREQMPTLKAGKSIVIPQYDFKTSARSQNRAEIGPFKVLIFEGIHVLYDENLRKLLDYKIFVDFPGEGMLQRRIKRDQIERGSSLADILSSYADYVLPMHLKFIEPTKVFADIVVSGDSKIAPIEIAEAVYTFLSRLEKSAKSLQASRHLLPIQQ